MKDVNESSDEKLVYLVSQHYFPAYPGAEEYLTELVSRLSSARVELREERTARAVAEFDGWIGDGHLYSWNRGNTAIDGIEHMDSGEAVPLIVEFYTKRTLDPTGELPIDYSTPQEERIIVLEEQLQTACEWGAALWNTLDGGMYHLPDDFRENYVEGSRVVEIIPFDEEDR